MKTYAQPLALWVVAVAGLLLALVADGMLEQIATSACALPLVMITLCIRRSARTPGIRGEC